MPLSTSVMGFLSSYEGLGRAQPQFLAWLHERKESIRAELLLAQLKESAANLRGEAVRRQARAASAVDDAEDAQANEQVATRAEAAALSAVEAAVQARNEDERKMKEEEAAAATQRKLEAAAAAVAAHEYIGEAGMRAEQASEAAKEGEALLARVETAIRTDGVPTWDVVDRLQLPINARLQLFRDWDGCEVRSFGTHHGSRSQTQPDWPQPNKLAPPPVGSATAAAAGATAAPEPVPAAAQPQDEPAAARAGGGCTALELVRLLKLEAAR